MKQLMFGLLLIVGQVSTLQDKPAVHLQPNRDRIEAAFGGKLLELIHAPSTIHLPTVPPEVDGQGLPWTLDVKNLGPTAVTITGTENFSVELHVGGTIHIRANGVRYSQKF